MTRPRAASYRQAGVLDTSDRSPILQLDPHGEIEPVDIERDVHVLGVQIQTGRIVKASDFAPGEDKPTNGVRITRPAFQPIPKMDRAEFILVRSVDAIVAHRDEANLIG